MAPEFGKAAEFLDNALKQKGMRNKKEVKCKVQSCQNCWLNCLMCFKTFSKLISNNENDKAPVENCENLWHLCVWLIVSPLSCWFFNSRLND